MLKKDIIKLFILALIILAFVMALSNVSAVSRASDAIIGMYDGNSGELGDDDVKGVKNVINNLIGIFQVVGVFLAVAMLMFLGIKYMSAAPGEKAEVKKHLSTYVIGAVVLFSASGILGILKGFWTESL